ncbi:MAG: phosphoglycerate mutase (2,3-diphosphoglycerate-independent) [Candidatus Woykebacteria bacterium RBG_16_43_9]|uniref:2,3-bisphosphoglycerate-independent phosphoglycerate mutase n=1 Tax=Candidatus Woykebacteria bacterium RBG_16_43_9 TaxID=1802596 RepID=A0A1G1WHE6_9BACT|nr:MAG: phosphoglycerate mutase (2,3-diphosphoglycerate-independent) [Candidatus Woykebacteria bacterium RBG_16_43_9]
MIKALKPLALIILDGWGVAPESDGNAISLAHKPFWDRISVAYPHTTLLASGEEVGLPKGEAGNSEVGHLNIGAGMIVYQELPRVNMAISDGSFLNNKALLTAAGNVKRNKTNFHLIGLVGRGSVHSSLEHLYALLWFAKSQGVRQVYLHLFTDGRDSPPTSGLGIIKDIVDKCAKIGIGKIATICGRYYAMDRDKRWDRTERCYQLLVEGKGSQIEDPTQEISELYKKEITDEFIEPLVISENGGIHPIKNADTVVFFNFRSDRARQLTEAFVDPTFSEFPDRKFLKTLTFITMTQYERNLPVMTAFPPPIIDYPLAAVLSMNDLKQLHIGETEKYAHVTYFLNGGREDPYPGEDRVHIPSPKVATYDKKPDMSATEITNYVCSKLEQKIYDVFIINFANADMVAHTGALEATIKAVETLDVCLERITKAVLNLNGVVVVTADHGNAETMIDIRTGGPDTEHNSSPVPLILVSDVFKTRQDLKLPVGVLADVTPTTLSLLGITVPGSMTGRNLLPK